MFLAGVTHGLFFLGTEMWKPMMMAACPSPPQPHESLGIMDADISITVQPETGHSSHADGETTKTTLTFFRVAEVPLTSSTFLGEVSMNSVDFFAQTFSYVHGCPGKSAVVSPQEKILVVPWPLRSLFVYLQWHRHSPILLYFFMVFSCHGTVLSKTVLSN